MTIKKRKRVINKRLAHIMRFSPQSEENNSS